MNDKGKAEGGGGKLRTVHAGMMARGIARVNAKRATPMGTGHARRLFPPMTAEATMVQHSHAAEGPQQSPRPGPGNRVPQEPRGQPRPASRGNARYLFG